MEQTLKIVDENRDLLKFKSPVSAQLSKGPSHPVEKLEVAYPRVQGAFKEYTVSNTYGSGMFLKLKMEQEILSQPLRLPGLQSSYAGLDTMLGRDEDFGFEDFMNLPEFNADKVELHDTMERRLGMGIEKLH
eukprot:TRINITY_DN65365_c0_g1_i1.p1 TRINITY_DN65365_c0_g1~~TRINITY_DN65365_c0_g1_i1.p1  ORF type:complete len:132 (+),score=18.71 TRINITY_DN65365_c0_g1_i1:114-509(+)